jgi:hypothetical protein
MGVATSTITFFRQMGASIWLAISGSIFSAAFREQLPARMTANGVTDALASGLTSGTGAVASEASTNVGDLGALILAALPAEARAVVEPFVGGIVAAMHETFSLATGTAFWIGIAAVALAFVSSCLCARHGCRSRGLPRFGVAATRQLHHRPRRQSRGRSSAKSPGAETRCRG